MTHDIKPFFLSYCQKDSFEFYIKIFTQTSYFYYFTRLLVVHTSVNLSCMGINSNISFLEMKLFDVCLIVVHKNTQ